MEEQTLVAFAFLPLSAGDSAPTLALLYVDVDGERKLATRSLLNVPTPGSNKSLVEIEVSPPTGHITKRALTKDWDAEMIVSIPAYEPGIKPGILVLGEGQAVWFAVQEDVSTPGSQRRRSSSATSPDNRRDKGKGRASIDKGKAPAGRLDYCTAKLRFGKIVSYVLFAYHHVSRLQAFLGPRTWDTTKSYMAMSSARFSCFYWIVALRMVMFCRCNALTSER